MACKSGWLLAPSWTGSCQEWCGWHFFLLSGQQEKAPESSSSVFFLLLGTGQMDSALVPHLTLKTLPGLVSGYQAAGQGSGCLFPLYLAASWWTKCPSPIQINTFQTAFLLFRAFLKQNSKLGVSWQTVLVQTSSKSCLAKIFKWVPSAIPRNKNLGLPRPYPPF